MKKLWLCILTVLCLCATMAFAACGKSSGTPETPATYTVTVAVNEQGYGTVSQASVTGIAKDTAITVNGATLTIGETVVTATPTAATAQYTYAFVNWTGTADAVTENITVTANFTRTVNTYTVIWANEDGTAIETDTNVAYGTVPTFDGTEPTKAATAQYTYTFGWDKEIVAVTGDTTYTATFTPVTRTYTITFEMGDGAVIDPIERDYGTPASELAGINVTAPEHYHFVKWQLKTGEETYVDLPADATLTENITVKAVWDIDTYTVSIASSNTEYGTVSQSSIESVPYDTAITVNENVITIGDTAITATAATGDAQYSYSFTGFTGTSDKVTGNMTITANFSQTTNVYTVSFETSNADYGTVSQESVANVPYGTVITVSENVITVGNTAVTATAATGDAQYTYAFTGFTGATATVQGNVGITANFSQTTNVYTVSIAANNADYGTVSQASVTVPYGTAITVDGATVTVGNTAVTATATENDAQYSYGFTGFTGATATVTGNVEITANFTQDVNQYTVTFEMDGGALSDGTDDITSLTVDYGTSASELDSLIKTKTGYNFSKWLLKTGTDSYVDLPANAIVETNVTLKAVWEIAYKMTVNANAVTLYFDTTAGAGSFDLDSAFTVVPSLDVIPANEVSYSYVSDATDVATVTDAGVITAVNGGTATVTVTLTDLGTEQTLVQDVTVTVVNYCEIADKAGFDAMSGANYYRLTADIDLGTISTGAYDLATGYINTLDGTLDGNGHKLTYAFDDAHYRRLFGTISAGAIVKNVYFEIDTSAGNKAGQYGVVSTNSGTIENCFIDVTIKNVGNAANGEGGYAKAGVARANWGYIRNNVILVTYTGTADPLTAAAGVIWHDYEQHTSNNMLVAISTNGNADIPFNAYVHYAASSDPVDANNVKVTSISDALDAFDDFVTAGFNKGTIWTTDGNGNLSFGGTEIFAYPPMIAEGAFDNAEYVVAKDGSLTVNANLTYGGDPVAATYSSSNANIAVNADTGVITTTNAGETIITASYNDVPVATCVVDVYSATLGSETTYATFVSTITADLSGCYLLTGDINLGNINATDHQSYVITSAFSGVLNGAGYKITFSSSWVNGSSNHEKALFASVASGGVVRNLAVTATFDSTNGCKRSAIARFNAGLIENCFFNLTYGNGGQTGNTDYGSAGVVLGNTGTINNCIVKLTYTGGALNANDHLCAVCTNNTGGTISNVIACKIVTNGEVPAANIPFEAWGGGTQTNKALYTSEAATISAMAGHITNGFALGTLWTATDGVYYNGTKVIG